MWQKICTLLFKQAMVTYLLITAIVIVTILSYLFYSAKTKKKGNRGID
jgi:hypothetical protein